ncbi:hypothetical protein CC86DRAFT_40398 [Ophiobolus disseminans]|uniref:DUF676 domain-containing protein n=1 Tax=Ophiobolus disseminans TaxID=1469910 RepID=A0A6A6ZVX1_9PLEO|nr:hypothetical protein CC86DRAFT_40398 [Ophiobolus disseminans]
MSSDFIGLKVIWPPTGIRPPKHEHDIVFVHGLHHGSISDWQDDDGVCWPAELLSLDLGKARVLAFGYDPDNLNLKSDSRYKGGLLFNHGEDLWTALKTMRRFDKVQVPITLIGHGTGGIVIKSALCISHFKREQFDSVLSKTKHVVLLSAPQIHLTWEAWTQITHGTSSAGSKDQWKAWLAANDSSRKTFDELAQYINVTSVSAEHDDVSPDTQPDVSKGCVQRLVCTITQLM